MKAIIMAGGEGTRLHPYTMVLPKPLIPIGNKAILELLIKRLEKFGFSEVIICIGYLGSLIKALVGDGNRWGTKISFSEEKEPLGTMGPLTLVNKKPTDTFLVCNGDTLTDLNLHRFLQFHKKKGGIATIAGIKREIKLGLGTFELDGDDRIGDFVEKPKKQYFASMGIYLFEPQIFKYIPKKVPFGFDDLMYTLISEAIPIYSYIHDGYWFDIGIEDDCRTAQREFGEDTDRLL
jgi:mannose-1-phosphate guanylyltransferase